MFFIGGGVPREVRVYCVNSYHIEIILAHARPLCPALALYQRMFYHLCMTKKRETKRISKNKAKGTADVQRTAEGVAIEEVALTDYSPGETREGQRDLTAFHRFSLSQLEFLREYAKDCDHDRSGSAVGVSKYTVNRWLQEPKFQSEIEEIHDVWRLNIKMTAETAAARHIKLMNQLEKDYHLLEIEDRSKMANPLVKASETYLKAVGHFNHGGTGADDAQVVINIDLGGDPDNEKKVVIDGGGKKKK